MEGVEDVHGGYLREGETGLVLEAGPRRDLTRWLLTRATTAQSSGGNCDDKGFVPRFLSVIGLDASVPAVLRRCTRSARVAGRWSVLMAGWTTGVGWWCGTIGIPRSTSHS